jgi:hypothetical protein
MSSARWPTIVDAASRHFAGGRPGHTGGQVSETPELIRAPATRRYRPRWRVSSCVAVQASGRRPHQNASEILLRSTALSRGHWHAAQRHEARVSPSNRLMTGHRRLRRPAIAVQQLLPPGWFARHVGAAINRGLCCPLRISREASETSRLRKGSIAITDAWGKASRTQRHAPSISRKPYARTASTSGESRTVERRFALQGSVLKRRHAVSAST